MMFCLILKTYFYFSCKLYEVGLSKEIINRMNLKEDDEVSISIDDGKMIIEKINKPKYLNLKERLEAFYNKPIDEIYVESTQEVDTGIPKGEEVW